LKKVPAPWRELQSGGVFISESLSYKFGLEVGDAVRLQTPMGLESFKIVAVVRDYSTEQGAMQMDREIYGKYWDDERVQSLALFLKPGVDPAEVRSRITAEFPGLDRTIATNQAMRNNILNIFDKTFAPTATLKGVTMVVALLGVATALMAIFIERSREMRLLGYLGMRPGQLAAMNVYQALVMALAAFMIACVGGTVLTYIITLAINYRSFGWSVDITFDAGIFIKTFVLTIAACLVSSIYPGLRMFRDRVSGALEEE
jgi:putative ABC transport system permease protein